MPKNSTFKFPSLPPGHCKEKIKKARSKKEKKKITKGPEQKEWMKYRYKGIISEQEIVQTTKF